MYFEKIKAILDEREINYGDSYQNFTDIGVIWGGLLRIPAISAAQVGLMMDALKTVRAFNNPDSADSWDDKIGYISHARNAALRDMEINK